MSLSGPWYDPITYQLSISCCTGRNGQNLLFTFFQSLLNEITPYIVREMRAGRQFCGIMADKTVPRISEEDDLLQFERIITQESRWSVSHCCLFSHGFLPRDAIPVKLIDPNWKKKVKTLMDMKQIGNNTSEQYKEWLQELMNNDSGKLEGICFPKSCFMPHPYPFYLGIKMLRCHSKEEYELYQESGSLDGMNNPGRPSCFLQTIHLSIPRSFFFNDSEYSFQLQENWVTHLKEMCSSIEISNGCIKADIMYNSTHENPLYTFFNTFKLGFRQRIGDIGWGMCLSKRQAELLGGAKALNDSNIFCVVNPITDGHVYVQLTPDVLNIPTECVKRQWRLLSPFIKTVSNSSHSIGDLPISVRLGIDSSSIVMTEYGYYSLCF